MIVDGVELVEATCNRTELDLWLNPAPRPDDFNMWQEAREKGATEYDAVRYCPYCNKEHEFRLPMREPPAGEWSKLPKYPPEKESSSYGGSIMRLDTLEEREAHRFVDIARSLSHSKLSQDLRKALSFLGSAKEIYERYERQEDVGRVLLQSARLLRKLGEIDQARSVAAEAGKVLPERSWVRKELEEWVAEIEAPASTSDSE